MAEITLTPEQQRVVDTRNCNLLVAAAAGSGKTAVLVKRIIKKVTEEEQDIDRLLIVTFTNAAAAEMRERIGAAIEEALEKNPENSHLQRQMLLLHNAQITTIHSFCLSVIREFFHLLSLDPGFRIGDEAELSLLKADVLERVLEECYDRQEEAFVSFVECFGSAKNNEAITGYIKKMYDMAMSQPWPEKWLDALMDGFLLTEEEFYRHPMLDKVMQEVRSCLSDCLSINERMRVLTEEEGGPFAYRDNVSEDQAELLLLRAASTDYAGFAKALEGFKLGTLSRKKQEVSEEKKQLVKKLREQIKKQIKKLKEDFFYESPRELWNSIVQMELPMKGLILVTKQLIEHYEAEKEEKNLLDFNDLEHMALRILVKQTEDGSICPTEAAKTISGRFDEIMIDEYQDSNLLQESVLTAVSGAFRGAPNVFMVGDVKQSIYRFRMACPDLFIQKYETYGDFGQQQKIDLAKNFRSRRCVLDAINVLFAGLMHKEAAEVEYDAAAALYFGASYPKEKDCHHTEVLFIPVKEAVTETEPNEGNMFGDGESAEAELTDEVPTEDGELNREEKTLVQAEAYAVARRIKELRHSEFTIGSEERQADYGDIVVLLRTMSGWAEVFTEVFAEEGIPAYADTGSGYFKTFEVRKTLDFLRVIDNPKQDIPFAAVLHSPIGGFHAQELAELRIRYGAVSAKNKTSRCLYDAAREAARAATENQGKAIPAVCEKAARFFAFYDRLCREAEYCSIHELLERFYVSSGFYDAVTVMPGGERRRGNLDMLVVRAKQYEATSFSGLYDFIRYMDRLVKYEVDFGEANSTSAGQMVRIMSIHKSKGLEFPVVFLCGMEKKLNRKDMQSRLIFHSELGLGTEFVDAGLRVKSPTLLKKVIAKQMNREMIAEELRVLYVAMTRAREKLIMVGAMKEPEKRYAAWQERAETVDNRGLLASYLGKAATYYDFICPLLMASQKSATDQKVRPYTLEEWKSEISSGVLVSLLKHMENESFPEAVFSGSFVMRECGFTTQDRQQESLRKTKEELLLVLQQMKQMEAEESETAKQVRELLTMQEEYRYPYGTEANLPVKVTVSELKRLILEQEESDEAEAIPALCEEEVPFEDMENSDTSFPSMQKQEEEEITYPEFLKPEKTVSGSDRGTIYHHVMELISFETASSLQSVQERLEAMVSDGVLCPEDRACVRDDKIWKFFISSLGERMCRAEKQGRLFREQPFVLGLSAKELYPELESEEMVLVQGIIDAFFEEEDGLVLMDYKTDYIHKDAKTELTKKYQSQLAYYCKALERLTGKQVKEIWFYAFSKGEAIQME